MLQLDISICVFRIKDFSLEKQDDNIIDKSITCEKYNQEDTEELPDNAKQLLADSVVTTLQYYLFRSIQHLNLL